MSMKRLGVFLTVLAMPTAAFAAKPVVSQGSQSGISSFEFCASPENTVGGFAKQGFSLHVVPCFVGFY